MRNWCLRSALSVLLASPLCAQQKAAGFPDDTATRGEAAAAKPSSGTNDAVATGQPSFSKEVFALPAIPHPKPFPKPQAATAKDTRAPGQLVPRYEISGMYFYVNAAPGSPFANFGNHGGGASFAYNASRWLGLTAELGGYNFNRNLFPLTGSNASVNGTMVSYLFGPRLNLRKFDYFVPFAHFLLGGAHSGTEMTGTGRQSSFAIAAGSVNPTSRYAGSGDSVAVQVNASDPDNDPLTYSYSATGGRVEGNGADARWNSTGVSVGSYTVNVRVDDGRGGTASCSADIKVEEKPNHPPSASLSVERSPILPGEHTGITCNGSDPDNDPLTYSYTASGGQITGSGSNVQFDATGLQPGTYTVKCTANDGRGGTADASGNVEVKEPPQVHELETKLALHSIYFPTAQPTEAKPTGGLLASQAATLDALASDYLEYLKFRPAAHLILEGHADSRGAKEYNMKLSERRVERARSYLVEKGVPADHLEVKAFGFEKNMTSEDVKKLLDADSSLAPAERQKLVKNIDTVRMANNRRVDVTLGTTGEQSVRRFPFNAQDALTLLSRGGGGRAKAKAPAARKPAPKAKTAAPNKP